MASRRTVALERSRLGVARAALELTRPITWLAVAMAVWVGAGLVDDRDPGRTWLAVATAVLAVAGSNVFNDLADAEVDALNRPGRPIPARRLPVGLAGALVVGCSLSSMVAGFMIRWEAGIVAVALVTVGLAYSARLQRRLIVSNLVVAGLFGAAVPFGAWAGSGSLPAAVWLGAIQVVAYLGGREILKDVADAPGDGALEIRTVATVYGETVAIRAVRGWFAAYALVALVPIVAGVGDHAYALAAILLAVIPALLLVVWLGRDASSARVGVAIRLTTAGFFTGLFVVSLISAG